MFTFGWNCPCMLYEVAHNIIILWAKCHPNYVKCGKSLNTYFYHVDSPLLPPKDPPPHAATSLTRLNTTLILVFLKFVINSKRWIPSTESILSPLLFWFNKVVKSKLKVFLSRPIMYGSYTDYLHFEALFQLCVIFSHRRLTAAKFCWFKTLGSVCLNKHTHTHTP